MCNGNKETLTEYKKQFLKDGKRPTPAELIFILAEHLKVNRPVSQHCSSIAGDIQKNTVIGMKLVIPIELQMTLYLKRLYMGSQPPLVIV